MTHTAPPPAEPTVTYSSGRTGDGSPPDLRLIHYNDVYHPDPSSAEPVGGVARFVSVVNEYRDGEKYKGQPGLITLFSGDSFNPSLESSITKGSHMVPILNKIGTDCAALGNHDLDFGVRQFRHLASKCNFPWLIANVLDPALGENVPIGNAKRTHMITASNGLKIGLIGLGEREWLDTINSLPPNLIYRSATETAKELVPQLRAEGADIIIAITHMREPNDNKLAKNMNGEIDLILGGHDHFYAHSLINGTHVLRSGCDFKQLSYLEVRRSKTNPGKWDVDILRRDIVSSITPDKETAEMVDKLTAKLKESLEKPIGWTSAPLDSRFTTVRTRESNIGNLVCDIMRLHYGTDCAIMAAGTIRGDQIYAPGPIRVKDVTDCFPFEDPVVVIKVTGKGIWEALENGVSAFPALEGRFPQVSNINFTFDPSLPPGSRVTKLSIAGEPIERNSEKVYVLATRGYMARGKDGYTSLLVKPEGGECEEVVSEENGILISMMLRQYFMALKVLDKWTCWGPSMDRHWEKVVQGVGEVHPTSPASPVREKPAFSFEDALNSKPKASWDDWTPAKVRQRRLSIGPLSEENGTSIDDKDDSDSDPYSEGQGQRGGRKQAVRNMDRELDIMRRVFRKWCRIAGVQGQACDALREDEFEVDWTKAVAPRVEGRIIMVGSA